MKLIKVVSMDDIVAASGNALDETRTMLAPRTIRGLYFFDACDYARVSIRGSSGSRPAGPVEAMKATWVQEADRGDAFALAELRSVAQLEADLRRDGEFRNPPILQDLHDRIALHDGRHRLIAAFACWMDQTVGRPLKVYWARPPCRCHPLP